MGLSTLFIISLLGSTHCAAMCGSFATICAHRAASPWQNHFAYNGGRLIIYLILGAIAGSFGASINCMGSLAGITHLASLVLGAALIVIGCFQLLGVATATIAPLRKLNAFFTTLFSPHSRLAATFAGNSGLQRSLVLGLLSGLLPCGWLYSFVAAAGATGSAGSATLVMFIFWLGTLPALLSVGKISQIALQKWGLERSRVIAALMLIAGLLTLTGRLGNPLDIGEQSTTQLQCH